VDKNNIYAKCHYAFFDQIGKYELDICIKLPSASDDFRLNQQATLTEEVHATDICGQARAHIASDI
jgi:hypothetical protein